MFLSKMALYVRHFENLNHLKRKDESVKRLWIIGCTIWMYHDNSGPKIFLLKYFGPCLFLSSLFHRILLDNL